MVRIKESSMEPIKKDRYYFWTWVPLKTKSPKKRTEKYYFRKHLTGIPYYTKYQIKRTLVEMYGWDVVSEIHIISGRKLLKQGIHFAWEMDPVNKSTRFRTTKFWLKGELVKARKFVIPDNYRIDKHRRRHFMVKMHQTFRKYGKKRFNEEYAKLLYGSRAGVSKRYLNKKRYKIRDTLIQELQEAQRKGEGGL